MDFNYNVLAAMSLEDIQKWQSKEKLDIHRDWEFLLRNACQMGKMDIVKWLVDKGANIHMLNDDALFKACFYNHIEITEYLLKIGADESHLPTYYIARESHLEIIKRIFPLLKNKKVLFHTFLEALAMNEIKLARYFLSCQKEWMEDLTTFHLDRVKLDVAFVLLDFGFEISRFNEKIKPILLFFLKMKKKRQIRATKTIYFWWIPICYNVHRACGQRMAEKSFANFLRYSEAQLSSCKDQR